MIKLHMPEFTLSEESMKGNHEHISCLKELNLVTELNRRELLKGDLKVRLNIEMEKLIDQISFNEIKRPFRNVNYNTVGKTIKLTLVLIAYFTFSTFFFRSWASTILLARDLPMT